MQITDPIADMLTRIRTLAMLVMPVWMYPHPR